MKWYQLVLKEDYFYKDLILKANFNSYLAHYIFLYLKPHFYKDWFHRMMEDYHSKVMGTPLKYLQKSLKILNLRFPLFLCKSDLLLALKGGLLKAQNIYCPYLTKYKGYHQVWFWDYSHLQSLKLDQNLGNCWDQFHSWWSTSGVIGQHGLY